MRKLVCVALLVAAGPVMANSLGLPNEVANGDFETGMWDPWENSGYGLLNQGDWAVPINPAGGQKWAGMVTSWQGNWGGPFGTIRQVVDESQFPGWIPDGTGKIIDIQFDYFLAATGNSGDPWRDAGLKVFLDWQGDGSEYPFPGNPGYQRQLVFEQVRNNSVPAPGWEHASIRIELPFQPQFLSIEFEAYAHFAEWTFVGVDNIDLEGQCIPEPASLALLALACVPMIRRRR